MEVYLLKGNGDSHIPQVDINGNGQNKVEIEPKKVIKKSNGGYNGFSDREFWYKKALEIL